MKKKIFLAGGAGYIGSVLTEHLLKKNYEVLVYDDFRYNENSLNHLYHNKNLNIIKGDVCDINRIKSVVHNYEYIIPLAALVGAPICNLKKNEASSVNKKSILELFKIIKKNQKIIMPTTNSAYGTGDKNNFCDEDSKLKPISKYAKDKVEIEKELIKKSNFISLRLATVFGMSQRMRMDLLVNDFVYRALREKVILLYEGGFKRNYIHVADVARVFIHSIENYKNMKNNIYNVGLSNANLSKYELCMIIKKFIPDLKIIEDKTKKDPDQRNYLVSNRKIEKTKFKAKFSIQDGIRELIKGYNTLSRYKYGNI